MPFLLKGLPLLLFVYRLWRRLPAEQRRRVLWAAGRHGPRIATTVWRRSRARA